MLMKGRPSCGPPHSGMSYLFYYTEQPTPGIQNHDKLKLTKLTLAVQCLSSIFYRADKDDLLSFRFRRLKRLSSLV